MRRGAALLVLSMLLAAGLAACASGRAARLPTIEPLTTATAGALIGGEPANALAGVVPAAGVTSSVSVDAPTAAATAAAPPTAPAPEPTSSVDAPTPARATEPAAAIAPEPAAAPPTSDGSLPPNEGRWIDVDVTSYVVRLMDGTAVVRGIGPIGVGEQIDTGAYASTQTGLFRVYNKAEPLVYDAPYKTYISDWVGFDPEKANGFHSFLKDADGNVVDASTGRVSNGCIRTGDAADLYAFAEIGMPVYVHR